jgi:hypothetical protein
MRNHIAGVQICPNNGEHNMDKLESPTHSMIEVGKLL